MTVLNNADQMFSGSEQVMGVYQGSDFIWGPFNEATGGTDATITNYNGTNEIWKTHTFTSGTSSLNVIASNMPFRVLVVGGGGGSGPWAGSYFGGHGGGGGVYEASTALDSGTQSVTIGGGGKPNGEGAVTPAGESSLTGVSGLTVVVGRGGSGGPGPDGPGPGAGPTNGQNGGGNGYGGGGGNGPGRNCSYYPPSGANLVSNISGASVTYSQPAAAPFSTEPGNGGRGCDGNNRRGSSGIVIVAYRIG